MKRFQLALCALLGIALVGFALQMGCDQAQDLFLDAATGEQKYTEAQIDRGEYLVMNVALCVECHTPFGPTGPDLDRFLAGGQEFIPGRCGRPILPLT